MMSTRRASTTRRAALYSVDRFADAAVEFEAVYSLAPKPLFLFNVVQSLRRQAEVARNRTTASVGCLDARQ